MGLLWVVLVLVGALAVIFNGPVARFLQRKQKTFTTGVIARHPVINRLIMVAWGVLLMGIAINNLLRAHGLA